MTIRFYQSEPTENQLLAAMPVEVRERIFPHLERVALPLGKELYESGSQLRYVYFPTNGIVSLLYVMKKGESAQIATVGNEGVVGIAVLMGSEHGGSRAIVHGDGYAYRLLSSVLKEEFNRDNQMRLVMLRYFYRLLTQVAQIALCNRYHTVEQQVCRCLLLFAERTPNHCLMLTQELIAKLLGVRREGVTIAAGKLQQQGAICYHRGHIRILNKAKLEQLGCECYATLKNIN